MKATILRRAMLAGAIATSGMIGTTAATPAHAQFGGIVYHPSNYAQNVLTAARSLQQINNQITQIQNQAQSLINQARNLTSLSCCRSHGHQVRLHEPASRSPWG